MSESVVTDWRPLLGAAHRALRVTVAGVPRGSWDQPTPCTEWTVTQVFQHAVGDQLGYASFLTGGPLPDEDPFAPSGRLDDDPNAIVDRALKLAAEAWAGVGDTAEEVRNPLP